MERKIKNIIEKIIFGSRWILIACFIKLIFTLVTLIAKFIIEGHLTPEEIIKALEDVDIVMIANLIKSIITGSYNSFVTKDHPYKNENVSSGTLKVKMGTSLVGISSILLLQIFLSSVHTVTWDLIFKLLILHGAFLVSSLVLAAIELIHCKSEYYEALTHSEKGKHNKGDSHTTSPVTAPWLLRP